MWVVLVWFCLRRRRFVFCCSSGECLGQVLSLLFVFFVFCLDLSVGVWLCIFFCAIIVGFSEVA